MNFASLFPMIALAMACSLMADEGWRLDEAGVQAAADRLDEAMMERSGKAGEGAVPPLVDDATFLRRACVDLAGRLPTADEVVGFCSDGAAEKRAALVDRLLLEQGAADLRFQRLADMLRLKDEVLGASQKPYIDWLKQAVGANMPYDEWVRQLLLAEGSLATNPATGFLLRDAGNLLVTMDEMTRGFLGENIHCAACHDHPFADWTQKGFYELAACFTGVRVARVPAVEISKTMKAFQAEERKTLLPGARPVGKRKTRNKLAVEVKIMDGELWPTRLLTAEPFRDLVGSEQLVVSENDDCVGFTLPSNYKYRDGEPGELVKPAFLSFSLQDRAQNRLVSISQSGMSQREKLAAWMTGRRNPRFAMVGATRVWSWLFGPVTVVEQANWCEEAKTEVAVTEMMRGGDCREAPGSWGWRGDFEAGEKDPLFVALRDQFIACQFDLREMTRIVARTMAYQRESIDPDYSLPVNRIAPLMRRIPSEVILDTLVDWQSKDALPAAMVKSIDERQVPADGHPLQILGRGSREWTDESLPLISFSLTRLMSCGDLVSGAAKTLGGPVGLVTDSQAITRRLFLAVLSREPLASEIAAADRFLVAGGSADDVAWALLNTSEFLFNH